MQCLSQNGKLIKTPNKSLFFDKVLPVLEGCGEICLSGFCEQGK